MNGLCRLKTLAIVVSLCFGAWSLADPDIVSAKTPTGQPQPKSNVFRNFATALVERPLILPVIRLFREKQYNAGERVLRWHIRRIPDSPLFQYNLAAALARENKIDEALDSLVNAIKHGLTSMAIIERDPDLEPLRDDARYRMLISGLKEVLVGLEKQAPIKINLAKIEQRRAIVSIEITSWEPRNNILLSRFKFEREAQSSKAHGGEGQVAQLLNNWFVKGQAAENYGDLYDNRDRGHSTLSAALLSQVAHIDYGVKARAVSLDYGVNPGILFHAITFGNSSTALTHSFACGAKRD